MESSDIGRPRIVAHRGASKAAPENTLEAFRLAAVLGASMVELDVRRTLDGVLVVHHDPVVRVDGNTRKAAICDLRREELPAGVATLSDALDTCSQHGLGVNIEIKSDEGEPDFRADRSIATMTLDLLATRTDDCELLISSFDRTLIDLVHRAAGHLPTGVLFSTPSRPVSAFLAAIANDGHAAIHPHYLRVTAKLIDAAHAHGLQVNVWTVDRPSTMRRMQALGVDAVITNVPDVAIATLR